MTATEHEDRLRRLLQVLREAAPPEAWAVMPEALDILGPVLRARLRRRFRLTADECDDVLSSTLVRVFENRSRLRRDGSLAGYLVRVADRLAIDLLRRPNEDAASELEHVVLAEDRLREPSTAAFGIARALDELDPTDTAILRAFSRSGDSDNWTRAIAEELGLTPNAVRVRKHRALARLKQAYMARHVTPRDRIEEAT